MITKFSFLPLTLDATIVAYIDKMSRDKFLSSRITPLVSCRNFYIFATQISRIFLGEAIPFQTKIKSKLRSKLKSRLTSTSRPSTNEFGSFIRLAQKNWSHPSTCKNNNKPHAAGLQITFFWLTSVNAFDVNAQLKGFLLGKNVSIASSNARILIVKWVNFEFFLINFFYFRGEFMSFGNPHLHLEIEAMNWNSRLLSIHEWLKFRASFSTHIFRFSEFGDFFFAKIKTPFKVVFFFSDLIFQQSNRFYFSKKFWPTIGVVDSSTKPWVFLFALPVFMNTTALQLFGLKFITRYRKANSFLVFQNAFQLWSNSQLSNTTICTKLMQIV